MHFSKTTAVLLIALSVAFAGCKKQQEATGAKQEPAVGTAERGSAGVDREGVGGRVLYGELDLDPTVVPLFDRRPDSSKLRLEQKPATPGGVGGLAGGPSGSATENIVFRFARMPGGTSKVTVVFPEGKIEKGKKAPAAKNAAKEDAQMQAAALGMMKQFFNGLKISIVMQPAGRILKTNSPYVQGQQGTLLGMDFGQLLADETMLSKLQGATTIEEAKTLMKSVKGAKVNLDREVTVEFAGR